MARKVLRPVVLSIVGLNRESIVHQACGSASRLLREES